MHLNLRLHLLSRIERESADQAAATTITTVAIVESIAMVLLFV